jgi:hypothetical protein
MSNRGWGSAADQNWDYLRYFLAVAGMGTLSAAVKQSAPGTRRDPSSSRPFTATTTGIAIVDYAVSDKELQRGSSPSARDGYSRPVDGEEAPRFAVLVFSKTAAFRHDSIPAGIAALRALVDAGEQR